MKWSQLPIEEQASLHKAFLNDPETKRLDLLASKLQRTKQYIQALEVRKEIDRQWEALKKLHCDEYEKVIEETVKLSDLDLPEEVLRPLLENILSIFMCCCIIETAYYDANAIIKKVNKDYSIDNFSDLVGMIDIVKRKLKYLQEVTGYMDDLYWYDSIDKFHDMVRSKARSILKKKDNINRWGKNFKKYIDGTL